jgi:hypothetical protein
MCNINISAGPWKITPIQMIVIVFIKHVFNPGIDIKLFSIPVNFIARPKIKNRIANRFIFTIRRTYILLR